MKQRTRDETGKFVPERDVIKYRITVWNAFDGEIERKLWEASDADLSEIEEAYGDDPMYSVDVEDLQ